MNSEFLVEKHATSQSFPEFVYSSVYTLLSEY